MGGVDLHAKELDWTIGSIWDGVTRKMKFRVYGSASRSLQGHTVAFCHFGSHS